MKEKMTVDQFNAMLVDLEKGVDSPLSHMGVRLVAQNNLNLDYF